MLETDKHGPLPPGQRPTSEWPILHAGSVPNLSKSTWSLKVYGEVGNPLKISYDGLLKMKHSTMACDIHCVMTWTKQNVEWEGVRFSELMEVVKPNSKAKYAIFEGENEYKSGLELSALNEVGALIAFKVEGQDLDIMHGGPVRIVVPNRYFYKSTKWVKGIKIAEHDELGTWENGGYSNTADPWQEDRYAVKV